MTDDDKRVPDDKAANSGTTETVHRTVHVTSYHTIEDPGPGVRTVALWVGLAILALVVVTWVVQGDEFFLAKAFWPRMEQTRRDTFVQNQAFIGGYSQELDREHDEWIMATPVQRKALASVILHMASEHDETKLSENQRAFLREVRGAQ